MLEWKGVKAGTLHSVGGPTWEVLQGKIHSFQALLRSPKQPHWRSSCHSLKRTQMGEGGWEGACTFELSTPIKTVLAIAQLVLVLPLFGM